MADLTRAFDWSKTPVGPVEQWPDTLLITLNMLLATRQPMFLWWGEELVQFYNDAYRQSLGADKHPGALGQNGVECWPEIWPIIYPQIEAVMKRGEACWHEDQLVPIYRDGKLEDVYWTYSYSPVRDPCGNIRGTLVNCTETTGRVLAERKLKQEREWLADLFQQAPAFFAVMRGPEHVFEMTNPLYQELIGNRKVIGKEARAAVPEAESQGFLALLDRVYQTGEPFVGHDTHVNLARGGSQALEERVLNFVYQPMRDGDGATYGIIVLGVDVTEGKRTEQALIDAEKIAAVGRLASSIAHEINNPLEAVTNLLYLIQTAQDDEERMQYLAQAQEELARVATISTQTLRFHRQSTRARSTSLREVMESVLTLMQGRLNNLQIAAEMRYRTGRQIKAYEADLRQVFANVIGNAIDATGHGGHLVLAVHDAVDWENGEQGIRVSIADTGCGMSEETRARIFEPFFTTKGFTGTGLGLWVSAGILQNHRARVRVRSSQSPKCHGTIFSIFFPLDFES
jgi:PAS domain S-box-containing protein